MGIAEMASYTDSEKAQAVGLALSIGVTPAAARLGMPRRTLDRWMADVRKGEGQVARIIPGDTRQDVANALWQAVRVGTEEVLAGLRDPKARLSDKARALEVVSTQYHLMTGAPTERTETVDGRNLTPEEMDELAAFLRSVDGASDDELRADVPNLLPNYPRSTDVG